MAIHQGKNLTISIKQSDQWIEFPGELLEVTEIEIVNPDEAEHLKPLGETITIEGFFRETRQIAVFYGGPLDGYYDSVPTPVTLFDHSRMVEIDGVIFNYRSIRNEPGGFRYEFVGWD